LSKRDAGIICLRTSPNWLANLYIALKTHRLINHPALKEEGGEIFVLQCLWIVTNTIT